MVVNFTMSRYNPLNIDESKIVKKNKLANDDNSIKKEIAEKDNTVISSIMEEQSVSALVVEQTVKSTVLEEPISGNKDKIMENYFNIINHYIDESGSAIKQQLPNRQDTVNEILQDTYQTAKTPVYNYSKDIHTGEINIETKILGDFVKQTAVENSDKVNSIPKQELNKLLDETNRNIIRTKIELRIHVELIQDPKNETKRKWYESKIRTFKDDLDYLTQRKVILERM